MSYELEPPQLAALKRAARAVGDDSVFVELLEVTAHDEPRWEFSVDGDGPYEPMELVLANAIFSPSGQWGLLVSADDHGVIGGVPDFMRIIADEFPPTARPTKHFWGPAYSPLDDVPIDDALSASQPIPVASGGAFGDPQALAFINYWKNFRDPVRGVGNWLPALFVHIYGKTRANRLLKRAAGKRRSVSLGKARDRDHSRLGECSGRTP